jgi:transposase
MVRSGHPAGAHSIRRWLPENEHQAAKRFGVAVSTAIGWVRRQRETGSVAPGKMGGHRPKPISDERRVWVLERTKARLHFARLGRRVRAEGGLKVDYRSVWEFVHAEKLSFKKSVVAGERDRPDVARRRAQWIKYQDRVEPDRLVFIDETWPEPIWRPRGVGRRAARGLPPRFHTAAGRP